MERLSNSNMLPRFEDTEPKETCLPGLSGREIEGIYIGC
jgi:hypothetical protein